MSKTERMENKVQLFNAVVDNDINTVKNLLLKGTSPNFWVNSEDSEYNQMSPLCATAIKAPHSTMSDMLIRHGADVNWVNKHGATALIYAVSENRSSIVEALLFNNADPNINKNWGGTALHWAASKGSIETVYILLKHGANPGLKNARNSTAAEWALANDHKELATLLEHAENKWKKNSDDVLVHRALPVMDMGITTLFNFKSMTATRIFKHFDMKQTRQTEMHFSDNRIDIDEINKAKNKFIEQGGKIDKEKFAWSINKKYSYQAEQAPRIISRRKKNSP